MTRTQALQYIRNTNGGATKANFIEDWEPVGGMEWELLVKAEFVEEIEGAIYLTKKGSARLDELERLRRKIGTPPAHTGEGNE